jgi:hypothetical protein
MEGILEHNEPIPDVGECSWQDNQDWSFDHWQNTPDSPRGPLLSQFYLMPCGKENATKRHRRDGRDISPRLQVSVYFQNKNSICLLYISKLYLRSAHSGRTGLCPGRLGAVNENLGTQIFQVDQIPETSASADSTPPLLAATHGSRGHTPHRFELQSRRVVVAGTGVHLQRTGLARFDGCASAVKPTLGAEVLYLFRYFAPPLPGCRCQRHGIRVCWYGESTLISRIFFFVLGIRC